MTDKPTNILWKLLYNEDLEEIPDPNRPENTAHLNALKKADKEQLERFFNGYGKVLVDRWSKKIKRNLMAVVSNNEVEKCNCTNCMLIREVRSLIALLFEAQEVLDKN